MTMAYVVVVNPEILAQAGMPVDGVLFATCLASAVSTLIMGLWANYPIALAPGMSLNAYFTYSIVIGRGIPWQTVLGVVFLSGLLFVLLTLTSIREQIVNGIPNCLKHGTAAGIGLFIAFIGLRNAKIIVANPATFVGFGRVSDPQVILAAVGLVLIAVLLARKIGSAILVGIIAIALAGIPFGLTHLPDHLFSLPHPGGTFLKLDLRAAAKIGLGELIFVFFFVDLFDNVGTLVRRSSHSSAKPSRAISKRPRLSQSGVAGRRLRNHSRRHRRDINRNQLYRKRRRSGRRSSDRSGQCGDCCRVRSGDVLRACGRSHSRLCDRSGIDPRWRADVRFRCPRALGRLHRGISRFPHASGDAAHV